MKRWSESTWRIARHTKEGSPREKNGTRHRNKVGINVFLYGSCIPERYSCAVSALETTVFGSVHVTWAGAVAIPRWWANSLLPSSSSPLRPHVGSSSARNKKKKKKSDFFSLPSLLRFLLFYFLWDSDRVLSVREPCFIGFGMEEREKGTSALFQTVRFYLTRVSDSGYCVPCVSVCTKDVSFISFPSASTRRLLTHKDVSKEKENGKKIRPVFLRHVGLTAIATTADIERSHPTFFFCAVRWLFFFPLVELRFERLRDSARQRAAGAPKSPPDPIGDLVTDAHSSRTSRTPTVVGRNWDSLWWKCASVQIRWRQKRMAANGWWIASSFLLGFSYFCHSNELCMASVNLCSSPKYTGFIRPDWRQNGGRFAVIAVWSCR